MPVDPMLLEILVCPDDRSALEMVTLPESVCQRLVEHYREQFKDEVPAVAQGLACTTCDRVYPIVSDIPVMLLEEALSRSELEA
jgi:uncharacterized protein YbaR (Trm112 family)